MTLDYATIGAIVTCSFGLASLIWGIRRDLRDLKRNGYTKAEACEHALRLKIANPALRVPDPRNPTRLIGGDE